MPAEGRWFAVTIPRRGELVLGLDAKARITFINPVAERVFGVTRDAAVGRPVAEVLAVVDPSTLGLPRVAEDALSSFLLVAGPHDGDTIAMRDVTELRHLEARLLHLERLASLGTLAAGMAHEINNPLSYVVANVGFGLEGIQTALQTLELLDEMPASGAARHIGSGLLEIQEALQEATQGAERVRRLAQELRKFGRSEVAPLAMVELSEIVESALKMTGNTLKHRAKIVKHYDATPPVEADETQLTQVFVNLLVNAGQAVAEGKPADNRITVKTYTDEAGRAVVEIADTGSGISPEHLDRIFEPFFTTKTADEGMGLGLAISQSVVATLGGEIRVESTVGAGTKFSVEIPPARARGRVDTPVPQSRASARRGRVLVVDDEPAVGRTVERMLKSAHDITVVGGGREAIAAIAQQDFDIIFCDVMMPSVSGLDVYAAVKSTKPELAKRIVFMTGGTFSAEQREFLDTIENVTLDKPFTVDVLRRMAADYASGRGG